MQTLTAEQAADIRARHDAVRAWLKARKRNSYKSEELEAAGLKSPTNEETSALEVFEFLRDKPADYFAYVKLPDGWETRDANGRGKYGKLYGATGSLTTWTGDNLGTIQFGRAFQDNFGGTRVPISCKAITGDLYHGYYYASAGDYARLKKAKVRGSLP